MTPKDEKDYWQNWRDHVLDELKQLRTENQTIRDHILDLKVEVAQLKVKAGLWGGVAGFLPMLIEKVLHR